MQAKKNIINILDFTEYPGLRHCSISDDSGEEFYHELLNKAFVKAFNENEILTINLDNTAGFAPSFLDEALGNLIYDFGLEIVRKHLFIISDQEPELIDTLKSETFLQWEYRREKGLKPKKTKKHDPWYIIENNILKLSSH